MVSPIRPEPGGAAWHEAEAGNFLRQANLIQEQNGHSGSAGALLYEAAKQCINAVANQEGINPGTTGAKLQSLRNISGRDSSPRGLLQNWQAAAKLHIHADRGHLSEQEFSDAWLLAQTFIDQMLSIYSGNEGSGG